MMAAQSSDEEIVHRAVDTLLQVVAKSADDLSAFKAALTRINMERPAPFPRAAVSTAESIIDHLTKVEEKLRELTIAVGL